MKTKTYIYLTVFCQGILKYTIRTIVEIKKKWDNQYLFIFNIPYFFLESINSEPVKEEKPTVPYLKSYLDSHKALDRMFDKIADENDTRMLSVAHAR